MRLSLRKGAWSVSTPQAPAGNRGNGPPTICCRCGKMLGYRPLDPILNLRVLTQGLKPVIFVIVYGPTKVVP